MQTKKGQWSGKIDFCMCMCVFCHPIFIPLHSIRLGLRYAPTSQPTNRKTFADMKHIAAVATNISTHTHTHTQWEREKCTSVQGTTSSIITKIQSCHCSFDFHPDVCVRFDSAHRLNWVTVSLSFSKKKKKSVCTLCINLSTELYKQWQ